MRDAPLHDGQYAGGRKSFNNQTEDVDRNIVFKEFSVPSDFLSSVPSVFQVYGFDFVLCEHF